MRECGRKNSSLASAAVREDPPNALGQRSKCLLQERSDVLGKRTQQFVLHPVRAAHNLPQRFVKVRPRHRHLLDVDGQLLVALVDLRVAPSESVQGSFSGEAFEVSSTVADGPCCKRVEQRGLNGRPSLRVQLEDFFPCLTIRKSKPELTVKPAGSSQGRVDVLQPVGRPDEDHLPSAVKTVHQSKEG